MSAHNVFNLLRHSSCALLLLLCISILNAHLDDLEPQYDFHELLVTEVSIPELSVRGDEEEDKNLSYFVGLDYSINQNTDRLTGNIIGVSGSYHNQNINLNLESKFNRKLNSMFIEASDFLSEKYTVNLSYALNDWEHKEDLLTGYLVFDSELFIYGNKDKGLLVKNKFNYLVHRDLYKSEIKPALTGFANNTSLSWLLQESMLYGTLNIPLHNNRENYQLTAHYSKMFDKLMVRGGVSYSRLDNSQYTQAIGSYQEKEVKAYISPHILLRYIFSSKMMTSLSLLEIMENYPISDYYSNVHFYWSSSLPNNKIDTLPLLKRELTLSHEFYISQIRNEIKISYDFSEFCYEYEWSNSTSPEFSINRRKNNKQIKGEYSISVPDKAGSSDGMIRYNILQDKRIAFTPLFHLSLVRTFYLDPYKLLKFNIEYQNGLALFENENYDYLTAGIFYNQRGNKVFEAGISYSELSDKRAEASKSLTMSISMRFE